VGPRSGLDVAVDMRPDIETWMSNQSPTELTGYKHPSANLIRSKNGAMSFRHFILRVDKQWRKFEIKQNLFAYFSVLLFYASKSKKRE
jgi:hypothetical protein